MSLFFLSIQLKAILYEFVLTQSAKINLFESLKVSVDMCFKTSSLLFQNNNTFYRNNNIMTWQEKTEKCQNIMKQDKT